MSLIIRLVDQPTFTGKIGDVDFLNGQSIYAYSPRYCAAFSINNNCQFADLKTALTSANAALAAAGKSAVTLSFSAMNTSDLLFAQTQQDSQTNTAYQV